MVTTVYEMLREQYLAGHVDFGPVVRITPDRRRRVMRTGAPVRRSTVIK
jgi:hypothetical protein